MSGVDKTAMSIMSSDCSCGEACLLSPPPLPLYLPPLPVSQSGCLRVSLSVFLDLITGCAVRLLHLIFVLIFVNIIIITVVVFIVVVMAGRIVIVVII